MRTDQIRCRADDPRRVPRCGSDRIGDRAPERARIHNIANAGSRARILSKPRIPPRITRGTPGIQASQNPRVPHGSSSPVETRVPHLRDSLIVAKVGIERSSTAFLPGV